ncbi:MAG: LysR substrate-binding domain-containing protein [Desertifilum sp.]|nr:LysR substrate-binding domain-containing protein [Desertifilum sp.]
MEIYQVKVFLEVAKCLSFTEAADTLNLTQPAVSAKIKSLETELGTPLFYRLGRKVQLTRVGEYLKQEGQSLIHLENRLIQEIEEIKQGKQGNLRLGTTPGLADGWLPDVLFKYRRQYPDNQTQCLRFDSTEALYRAIIEGHIDAGIADISFSEFHEVSAIAIDSIHYALMVSAHSPLAEKPWVSLRQLQHEPWVLLPEGTPSRLVFETRLAELGLSLTDFTQVEIVDSLSLMRTYVTQGGYIGFGSNFEFLTERQYGMLKTIPIEEFSLKASLFLLLPKRLSQAADECKSCRHSAQAIKSEPIQKFIALVQSEPSELKVEETPSLKPVVLQSPSFLIRPNSPQRPETLTLTIGTQNWTVQTITAGLVMQRLGLLEHFLPKEGAYSGVQYQIQWRDFYSGAPIVEGLRFAKRSRSVSTGESLRESHQLDIGILGDYPLLLSALPEAQTSKTRLISFIASNPDGSGNAVIVPQASRLSSIEDLRGRAIAVPFSSSAHGMVVRSLHEANLLAEVTLASIPDLSLKSIAHSQSTQVDAYAHFAPFHEIARQGGKFKRFFDGNMSGLPAFHGVVVREDFAEQHPDLVVAYLKALLAAQYWYATTPSAPELISQWIKLDAGMIAQFLAGTYTQGQTGQYFLETQIRQDWIEYHIDRLKGVTGNESLSQIDLSRWMQPEFLQTAQASV